MEGFQGQNMRASVGVAGIYHYAPLNDHLLQGAKARLAQPAERKALNLVVVASSPTAGV